MKTAVSTIFAATVALSAMAQTTEPNTMFITEASGKVVEYKLDNIARLSFGYSNAQAPELTSGPYAVGDYFFDGTCEGVVIEADATGSYGKIVAMKDAGDECEWSLLWEDTFAQDEYNGQANMATIAAIDPDYQDYPAFRVVAAYGPRWYLPAQKELQALRPILDQVNATLTARGYEEIPATYYWSSTEADQYYDAMAYQANLGMPGMFGLQKDTKARVRGYATFGEEPEARYQIGKYIEEDGKKGVIYWVAQDGTYAKIISLEEGTASWGALGVNTGATSLTSGTANLAAVKAQDSSLESYPAFSFCAAQGDGWYLPALNELSAIANIATLLNPELVANGGTALAWNYYWSSTEYTTDAANTAYALALTDDATLLGSSKSVERAVRPVAYVGSLPDAPVTYAIGDIFYEGDAAIGVVCEVSEDGTHGKIIALKNVKETGRINAMWDKRANKDEYVLIGADSLDDGEYNMQKAIENDPNLLQMPVFALCRELGDGWYPGATNELLNIYANKDVLNAALKSVDGGSALDNNDYWTSTEGSAEPAVRAASVNFKDGSTFDYRKYFYNLVRPMKKF